jgi:Cd2+/Zn2+-exporting ATPase
MSIAVTGALLLQQWPEAAMVMVLFTLAERIEARSLDRARHAIDSLLQLTPPRPPCSRRWQLAPCRWTTFRWTQ